MSRGIDAGNLHGAHVAKEISLAVGQVQLCLFVVEVDLILQMVCRAPVSLDFEEAFGEEDGEDIPIVSASAGLVVGKLRAPGLEERGEPGADVIALELLEAIEEGLRPGQAGDAVVGFVSAKAEDGFAELVAEILFVLLMGEGEELPGGGRVEIVLQRLRLVFGLHVIGVGPGLGGNLQIGLGASGRGLEAVLHDYDLPFAGGSCPVDGAVVDGDGDCGLGVLCDGGDGDCGGGDIVV